MPRYDHYARGTFGSAFGGSMGCVFGTVAALAVLGIGSVVLCFGVGAGCIGLMDRSQPAPSAKPTTLEKSKQPPRATGRN